MRFLFVALCVATLSFSSAYGTGNVNVAKGGSKAVKALTELAFGVVVACSGLTGCDQGVQMTKNVITEDVAVTEMTPNPVKIGIIYEHEYTLPNSYRGARLAANQANLAGGINGRYVELIPHKIYNRDEADTVNAAKNLVIYDMVIALVGANYSTLSEYIDEVATQNSVVQVAMGSTSKTLTRASDKVFLTAAPNSFQAYIMAKYAAEQGIDSAAVIFWSEDAYSADLAESFQNSFNELGTVVSYQGYSYNAAMGDEEFAAQLNESGLISAVAAAQPDSVFIPGFGESAIVVTELRKAGVNAQMLGADAWGLFDETQLAAIEGGVYTDHFHPDSAPEINKLYRDTYGMDMDGLAALGYDAIGLVVQAAREAGDDLDRATLRDAIEAITNYMGATNIKMFDENRHPIKDMVVFEIKNRKKEYLMTVSP